MVKLGELNSRMKDFFDIWTLSQSRPFNGAALSKAISQTFIHRNTRLDPEAVCFSTTFANLPAKQAQWKAFIRRSNLAAQDLEHFVDICSAVMAFLKPMMNTQAATLVWPPGGPWTAQERPT
jgi:hypothetical protein